MRITAEQLADVKMHTRHYFGDDAGLWLFGSRTSDDKRGGDYDFLIETSLKQPDLIIQHKIAMLVMLQMTSSFADEKIDLVVKRKHSGFDMPIYHVAQTEGIKL